MLHAHTPLAWRGVACRLPVIATNWSGLTAFINDEVAYPLRIDGLVDTVPDGPNFFM